MSVNKISNNLAEITWTPSQFGEYYVRFTVTDGNLSDDKVAKITVDESANHAPVLNDIDDINAYEGDTITLNPTATDEDNDTLTFSYSGWMDSNSKSTGYNDAGNHQVNVTVSDSLLSDSKTVGINILNSYQIRTAISDKITKSRLTGAVTADGAGKETTASSTATFDNVHAGEHSIKYSASGYKENSYTAYFDNGLASCSQGADCSLTGTNCKWNLQYSDWTCILSNQFMFVFNPLENAIKRIDYLIK